MKKTLLLAVILFIVISSCKKNTTEPNTSPEPADTAYLKKTERIYNYDQTGTQILDSSITAWTYDNKRRPATQIFTNFLGLNDTSFYSYPVNQTISRTVIHYKGVLASDLTETYFLNSSGNPDSVTDNQYYLGVNNGVQTPMYYYHVRYFYYDIQNRDTLEIYYSIDNNIKTPTSRQRLTYKGNELDSLIQYDSATNNINSVTIYSNGDPASIYDVSNGDFFMTSSLTYYDILSGGFYGYTGSRYLLQTLTAYDFRTPSDPSRKINYEFDSSNRVKTAEYLQTDNTRNQRREYAYY